MFHRNLRHGVRLGAVASAASFALLVTGMVAGSPSAARAADTEPLPLKLPNAVFVGTPPAGTLGPNVEKPTGKPRPVPQVPKGTVNLALHKKVTSSKPPFSGSLELVTDGNKEARADTAVELKSRVQWIQIDLGASYPLSYICFWHTHMAPIVYHSVVVQVSNDADFVDGVTTLFNNDITNACSLGVGKDREYVETNEGKLVDAKGVKARYVRLYSKGSTGNDPLNRYTEVEVYGQPK